MGWAFLRRLKGRAGGAGAGAADVSERRRRFSAAVCDRSFRLDMVVWEKRSWLSGQTTPGKMRRGGRFLLLNLQGALRRVGRVGWVSFTERQLAVND